jgi:hypothetical protein
MNMLPTLLWQQLLSHNSTRGGTSCIMQRLQALMSAVETSMWLHPCCPTPFRQLPHSELHQQSAAKQ